MIDTKLFAVHVLFHLNAEGGVFNTVSAEKFTKVFMVEFDPLGRLTERQPVIFNWVLVMYRRKLIYF